MRIGSTALIAAAIVACANASQGTRPKAFKVSSKSSVTTASRAAKSSKTSPIRPISASNINNGGTKSSKTQPVIASGVSNVNKAAKLGKTTVSSNVNARKSKSAKMFRSKADGNPKQTLVEKSIERASRSTKASKGISKAVPSTAEGIGDAIRTTKNPTTKPSPSPFVSPSVSPAEPTNVPSKSPMIVAITSAPSSKSGMPTESPVDSGADERTNAPTTGVATFFPSSSARPSVSLEPMDAPSKSPSATASTGDTLPPTEITISPVAGDSLPPTGTADSTNGPPTPTKRPITPFPSNEGLTPFPTMFIKPYLGPSAAPTPCPPAFHQQPTESPIDSTANPTVLPSKPPSPLPSDRPSLVPSDAETAPPSKSPAASNPFGDTLEPTPFIDDMATEPPIGDALPQIGDALTEPQVVDVVSPINGEGGTERIVGDNIDDDPAQSKGAKASKAARRLGDTQAIHHTFQPRELSNKSGKRQFLASSKSSKSARQAPQKDDAADSPYTIEGVEKIVHKFLIDAHSPVVTVAAKTEKYETNEDFAVTIPGLRPKPFGRTKAKKNKAKAFKAKVGK